MGCCNTSELCFIDTSEELNALIEENLLLLKAVYLHFVSANNQGVALKLLNVYKITSQDYYAIKSDREEALTREFRLSLKAYKQVEKCIAAEEFYLKEANRVLLCLLYTSDAADE